MNILYHLIQYSFRIQVASKQRLPFSEYVMPYKIASADNCPISIVHAQVPLGDLHT